MVSLQPDKSNANNTALLLAVCELTDLYIVVSSPMVKNKTNL